MDSLLSSPLAPVSACAAALPVLAQERKGCHSRLHAHPSNPLQCSLLSHVRPGSERWAPWNRLGVAPLGELMTMYGALATYFSREFAAGPAALGPPFQVSRAAWARSGARARARRRRPAPLQRCGAAAGKAVQARAVGWHCWQAGHPPDAPNCCWTTLFHARLPAAGCTGPRAFGH